MATKPTPVRYATYKASAGWVEPGDYRRFTLVCESGDTPNLRFLGTNSAGNLYFFEDEDGTESVTTYHVIRDLIPS